MKNIYYRYILAGKPLGDYLTWSFYTLVDTQKGAEQTGAVLLDTLLANGHEHAEVSITNSPDKPAEDMLT